MNRYSGYARLWLIAVVGAHLIISIVHGMTHSAAQVPLSRAANLFVFVVILVGPLAGLLLMWSAPRLGAYVVAITMAASLAFGFLNHFVFSSPDHVAHVASRWRPLFATTAVLLALTEALGSGLALRLTKKVDAPADRSGSDLDFRKQR
jgi:MFS family permease